MRGTCAALILAACGGGSTPGEIDAAAAPAAPKLDLLFVVDNSGDMATPVQDALASALRDSLLDPIEAALGVLPDLHLGVISTDMGAGPNPISNCAGLGDNGRLQNAPRSLDCDGPAGTYISDESDGGGGRIVNYTGTIEDTFACIVVLGGSGCMFEHPLASLAASMSPSQPFNAGFFRDDAALAVVILSNRDDCSAYDTAVFDTSQNAPDDPLGPFTLFRCFEFGVVCDPDEPRTLGVKTGCIPRADSPYLSDPAEMAADLAALKPSGRIVVAVMVGDPSPVEVIADPVMPSRPNLQDSCTGAVVSADPAIRLHAFASAFEHDLHASLCDGVDQPLRDLTDLVVTLLEWVWLDRDGPRREQSRSLDQPEPRSLARQRVGDLAVGVA